MRFVSFLNIFIVWISKQWRSRSFHRKQKTVFRNRGAISLMTTTEMFYSHSLNMNEGSLHTRSFRRIHFSIFRYRWIKNGFTGPKSFQGFRETGPSGTCNYGDVKFTTLHCICKWSQRNNKPPKKANASKDKSRGFITGRALGKLTGCEGDLAINLPSCFHLLFLLPIIRKTKNARLKNPTDLLHKNLMKPLSI